MRAGLPSRPRPKWKSWPITTPATRRSCASSPRSRRRQRGEAPSNRLKNARKPEPREDRELDGLRRQAEQRPVGLEEVARMRLEGDDGGRTLPEFSAMLEKVLMPAMHAVEIADGGERSLEALGHRLAIAADRERWVHRGRNLGTHLFG